MSEPATDRLPTADVLLSDAEKRRRVEAELSRLGMSPAEVHRLLSADAATSEPPPPVPPRPALAQPATSHQPPATAKPGRVTAASLEAYAAQLMAQKAAAQVEAIQTADLSLPEFRESSVQERLQAEPLLREAAMLRRRERFAEAEAQVRAALQLVPKDAAALELLGDLQQAVGRVDNALAAYRRATEADPKRSSAEKKFADLVMQQQKYEVLGEDDAAVNPFAVALLSALFPGFGHLLLREWGKGAFFSGAWALCVWLLGWSPWGFGGQRSGIGTGLVACAALAVVVYAAAMIDANVTARQGKARE